MNCEGHSTELAVSSNATRSGGIVVYPILNRRIKKRREVSESGRRKVLISYFFWKRGLFGWGSDGIHKQKRSYKYDMEYEYGKDENQKQSQSTYDAESGNGTRATFVWWWASALTIAPSLFSGRGIRPPEKRTASAAIEGVTNFKFEVCTRKQSRARSYIWREHMRVFLPTRIFCFEVNRYGIVLMTISLLLGKFLS